MQGSTVGILYLEGNLSFELDNKLHVKLGFLNRHTVGALILCC